MDAQLLEAKLLKTKLQKAKLQKAKLGKAELRYKHNWLWQLAKSKDMEVLAGSYALKFNILV